MSEPERGDRAPAPGPGEAERAPVAGATPVGPPASEARPAAGSEPAAPAPGPPAAPAAGEAAPAKVATPVSPAKPAAAAPPAIQRGARPGALAERPEVPIEVSRRILAARSRRDFLLLAAGIVASAAGAWWLLPDRARSHLAPGAGGNRLDRLAGRLGLTRERGERALDRALDFDDDIAEALYSKGRRVRTYDRSQVRPLRNNYHGRTPGPEYLPTWSLAVTGLASAGTERLALDRLLEQFALHEQVTRLVCVEGWSTIAW